MMADCDVPVLLLIELDDLSGAVAIDDHGEIDDNETGRLHHLVAIAVDSVAKF